jgi:hypothetical protein
MTYKICTLIVLFLLPIGGVAFADTMSVSNDVELHAETGGNTVSSGGSITTGSVSESVDIENNGAGADVHEYISTTSTSDLSIEVHTSSGSSANTASDQTMIPSEGTTTVSIEPSKKQTARDTVVHASTTAATGTTSLDSSPRHPVQTPEEQRTVSAVIIGFFDRITHYVWNFFTKN